MLNKRNLYVVLTSCILKVPSDVYRKTSKKSILLLLSSKLTLFAKLVSVIFLKRLLFGRIRIIRLLSLRLFFFAYNAYFSFHIKVIPFKINQDKNLELLTPESYSRLKYRVTNLTILIKIKISSCKPIN